MIYGEHVLHNICDNNTDFSQDDEGLSSDLGPGDTYLPNRDKTPFISTRSLAVREGLERVPYFPIAVALLTVSRAATCFNR